jgi:RimJ/RimL family protein N-acetyltransferase
VADPRIEGAARFGLVVDPAVRGHGVGRALLAELLRAAARVGYRSVRGQTADGNEAMQALARRAGFIVERIAGDEPVLLSRPLAAEGPPGRPGGVPKPRG